MSAARYVVGELVDLVVRGARVETVDERYVEVCYGTSDGGSAFISAFPSPQVRFTRVAPREWPPVPGDVWGDANGGLWWAREYEGSVQLQSQKGGVDEADWTLGQYGPMRLEYRKGWTPAPAVEAEPEPEKLDERAAIIAGMREFIDFIEAHPDLPVDRYTLNTQYHVRNRIDDPTDQDAAFAELRRIAAVLGVEPDLRDEDGAPHPHATKRFTGGIEYQAVYVTDAYKRGYKPLEDLTPPGIGDAPAADVAAEAAGAPDFNLGPVEDEPHRVVAVHQTDDGVFDEDGA